MRGLHMKESEYQRELIDEFKFRFPECIVLKNDSGYRQGFPDLTVFLPFGFACILEVKKSRNAPEEPNQIWYVNHMKSLGYYSTFVYPENEEEVLRDIQQAFESHRSTCLSQR